MRAPAVRPLRGPVGLGSSWQHSVDGLPKIAPCNCKKWPFKFSKVSASLAVPTCPACRALLLRELGVHRGYEPNKKSINKRLEGTGRNR